MDLYKYIDIQYDIFGDKPLSLLMELVHKFIFIYLQGCVVVKKYHTQTTVKFTNLDENYIKVIYIGGVAEKNINLFV